MEIAIDVSDQTPIFTQLINQVKEGVRSGALAQEMAMPSIRQLANDLGINQNTVAKAYKLLERDLVIVKRGYRGTFIHPEALSHCSDNLNEKGIDLMTQTVATLRESGLTDSEIRIAFNTIMKS